MPDLVPDRDDGPPFADTDPQKARQLPDHIDGALVMPALDHPYDRVQCIVQEMGVDLGLQGIQLAPSLLLLF